MTTRPRRTTVALGVVSASWAAAAACGFFGSGGDASTPTAEPTAPATTAPQPSPLEGIVERAPGSWTTEEFAPGGPIPWRHGIFFTDNITGQTTGLAVSTIPQQRPDAPPTPNSSGVSQEPFVTQYNIGGEGRWVSTTVWDGPEAQAYLLNRETGDAWTWDHNKLGLDAVSRDYLVFEQAVGSDPHQHSTGKYIVASPDMRVLSTFELQPSWFAPGPHVSDDGQAAIWVTRRNEPNAKLEHWLHLVDLRAGTSREIWRYDVELVGRNFEQTEAVGSEATAEGVTISIQRLEGSGELLSRIPRAARQLRFNWQGDLVSQTDGPGGYVSPDGQYMVFETFTRFEGGGGGEGGGDRWPVVTLAKADGTELLRVLSASMSFGDGMPGRRWLADSSGFLVQLDDTGDTPGWPGDNIGYAIVRLDGSIERLPDLPAMPEPQRWFESTFIRGPEPHPTDANLLAFGHFELLDLARGTWRGSPYVANDEGPMHVGPWVEGVEDRVFAIPHGGHGGWGPAVLLEPLVQRAPFAEPRMVVAPGGCLNLREAASMDAAILTCLAPGTELQLAEPPAGLEPGTAEYFEARVVRISESGTWLKVTQGGWVNSAFVRWAE